MVVVVGFHLFTWVIWVSFDVSQWLTFTGRDRSLWQEMERMVAMSRAQEVDLMTKNQTLQQSWSAQLGHVEFQEACQGLKMI